MRTLPPDVEEGGVLMRLIRRRARALELFDQHRRDASYPSIDSEAWAAAHNDVSDELERYRRALSKECAPWFGSTS